MFFINEKWKKYCALTGAHFALAPMGFLWSYGNFAPYLNSYYRFNCSPVCLDGDDQWVYNLFIAAVTPGLFGVAPLVNLVGMKRLSFAICLLCGVSLMVSAWTVSVSVIGTTVLLGALNGIGVGGILNAGMICVNGWAPEKSAFFSGTITSLPPVVAFIQNQIVTAYVNPRNLKPDVQKSSNTFFSQPQVLERVPNALLILGCTTLGLQLIGTVLISDPPKQKENSACVRNNQETLQNKDNTHMQNARQPLKPQDINGITKNTARYGSNTETKHKSDEDAHLDDRVLSGTSENTQQFKPLGTNQNTATASHDSEPLYSCTIAQAVKSGAFWTNSMFIAVLVYGSLLKNGYFKVFGLVYIPDDNLLTVLSSVIPLVEACIRFLFGILINRKLLALQDSLVLSLSLNAAFFSFFYFAPQVNFVTYLIVILGLSVAHGQLFVLYTAITFMVFGPNHFAIIYALGFLPTGVFMLLAGLIVTPMVNNAGWFWLFMTCSIPGALVLIAAVFTDARPNRAARLH